MIDEPTMSEISCPLFVRSSSLIGTREATAVVSTGALFVGPTVIVTVARFDLPLQSVAT